NRKSARKGPRQGNRQKEPEQRRRMEDRRLPDRQQRTARHDVSVPEREPPVSDRLTYRESIRKVREGNIGKDRIDDCGCAPFRGRALPGVVTEVEVGRPVKLAE